MNERRRNRDGESQRLISVKEAAARLGVHEKTVRRWITGGELRAHRLGRQWRVAPVELERFLRSRVV